MESLGPVSGATRAAFPPMKLSASTFDDTAGQPAAQFAGASFQPTAIHGLGAGAPSGG